MDGDKITREESVESIEVYKLPNLDSNQLCTRALYGFIHDYHEAVRFLLFTARLAARADEVRLGASMALASAGGKPEYVQLYEEVQANPSPTFDELKKFRFIQSQDLVLRSINAFLIYYSEIIQAAIMKRPETLKSKQTIQWDELLGFTRFDEVVSYLIDKKVNELSYAGLKKMEEFMSERLGIAGSITDDQRALAAISVEIRNIYTHNRGLVNGIFLARVKNHMGFQFVDGKYFHTDLDTFARLSSNCLEVAYAVDEAVAKKFGLKRRRYSAWHGDKKKAGS